MGNVSLHISVTFGDIVGAVRLMGNFTHTRNRITCRRKARRSRHGGRIMHPLVLPLVPYRPFFYKGFSLFCSMGPPRDRLGWVEVIGRMVFEVFIMCLSGCLFELCLRYSEVFR